MLHCFLLCRLSPNTYSRQKKLQYECHCDVPVSTISLPQGGGTCVLQTHTLLGVHSPHMGHWWEWLWVVNILAALLFLMVSFSSFLSCSCIIFCCVTPCGMKKKASVYQLLFFHLVFSSLVQQSSCIAAKGMCNSANAAVTVWQCGNTLFSASLYSQGVRFGDFSMVSC